MVTGPNIEKKQDLDAIVEEYLITGCSESKDNILKIGRTMTEYYAVIYSPGETDPGLKNAAKKGFKLALQKFDPSREAQFSTYATNCIISEIRKELNERRLFEVPPWLQQLQDNVIKATEELSKESSTLPSLEDVSSRLNIAEKGITEIMQAGTVPMQNIDLCSLKSLKLETFKLPLEDVITIRKSLDRLQDIQKRFLSLIQDNLNELNKAIKEEEQALSNEQARYLRLVENSGADDHGEDYPESYKIDFPEDYDRQEVLCYFEVLSDECGLRLLRVRFINDSKCEPELKSACICVPLIVELEGRYRGLIKLLDHLRDKEDSIKIHRVKTSRSKDIPARIRIDISAESLFNDTGKEHVLTGK